MGLKYSFIDAGKHIPTGIDGKLFLDVGNNLKLGIIDHHQPGAPKHSATYLVLENKKLISSKTDEIVVHIAPDLDCVASSYLAAYYIKNQSFPVFAEELALFIDKVDFGYSAKHIISLHSLYDIIKQECKNDEDKLIRGHKLIEELVGYGFESGILPDSLKKYKQSIEDDYSTYISDYNNSQTVVCKVPDKNTNELLTCTGLILKKPKSRLFKTWARNDTKHINNGYELLVVQLSDRRTVISVKSDGMFYLKGLGDLINHAEKKKMKTLNIHVDGENRPGYNMPDPWYDGRNPSHNYTIIDSPRRGSELSFEEVLDIVNQYNRLPIL